jgi:uncharacterized coiled-coil protein SlyX
MATVATVATSMKPRPPSSPRSSLLGDITNGAAGLLSGNKPGAEHEVARLSSKIMDLMSQLQQRDAEKVQLEQALEAARREAANLRALASAGAPAAAPAAEAPAAASSSTSRARAPAPRPGTGGNSPLRKDVMVRVLSAALREADATTALKAEELAAARAMLHHRSRGPSPAGAAGAADAPAPGVVARLNAELAEAAEERRNLRQQLQALRERLKDCQGQLSSKTSQLDSSERAREQLSSQASAPSVPNEEHRALLAELRTAQGTANNAEAKALGLERKLDVALAKQSELQAQLAAKLNELKQAQSRAAESDETPDLRRRLQAALDEASKGQREADGASERAERGIRDASERAERAETTLREQATELQRARAAAQKAAASADAESNAELRRLQQELKEMQRLLELERQRANAAAAAAAAAAAEAAKGDELKRLREQARATELELKGQIAALKAKLSTAEAQKAQADGVLNSAHQRAEELAAAHAAAQAEAAQAQVRHAGEAERAKADQGKAANELRYALRGKEKEVRALRRAA